MTPRRRPGPAAVAAAPLEARNHQRGVRERRDGVGATPGVPRPRPSITQHPTPLFSTFHQTRSEPDPGAVRLKIEKKTSPTSSDGDDAFA